MREDDYTNAGSSSGHTGNEATGSFPLKLSVMAARILLEIVKIRIKARCERIHVRSPGMARTCLEPEHVVRFQTRRQR